MDEVAEILAIKAIVIALIYEQAARQPDPKRYLEEKRADAVRLVRSAEIRADLAEEARTKALRKVAEVFDGITISPR